MMVKKQPYYRRGSPTETFQTEILDWMKMTSTIDAMELLARMKRLEELRAWAAYIAAWRDSDFIHDFVWSIPFVAINQLVCYFT